MLDGRFWIRWLAVNLALAALIAVVGWWPVTTRAGIDYRWSEKRIPLAEKFLGFVSRDLQSRRLAIEVAADVEDEQERLLRIFRWVTASVRPVPAGFPVVDDHIFHILVRGYGTSDQRTEAFALLASHAGFPSGRMVLEAASGGARLQIAVVKWRGKLHLLDVDNGVVFRTATGALASIDDLQKEPAIIRAAGGRRVVDGVPYEIFFRRLEDLRPAFTRIEAQRPWSRLRLELVRIFRALAGAERE